jgi:hypothetical protein
LSDVASVDDAEPHVKAAPSAALVEADGFLELVDVLWRSSIGSDLGSPRLAANPS